ncbi:hypothetical protein J5N97_018141 [Dioscorea zingiberensis]|uniref:Integrase catalytic domain-containing protein n=1 Tax=Dioscorea zingiberensis TaxID=325984 RepID=A0A9D5CMM3_9LILI|nr:hypothetical protein J5N97_018141 [Dioscorea zingiberensis]
MDNVYKLHGLPQSIVSDRDPIFLSAFWREFFKVQGVQLKPSTAYHPQTDGQTEVVNRCLEMYLRCMSGNLPKSWASWLSLAEFWYNTSYHTTIRMTPFQALYGIPPPTHLPYFPKDAAGISVDSALQDREAVIQVLKQQLTLARERMQFQANKHRTERTFEVGDKVYLRLQPYMQNSVMNREVPKLAARYYGPYPILRRLGNVAYKLELPPSAAIHPVFHVSLLKKALPTAEVAAELPSTSLPPTAIKPLAILNRKMVRRNNRAITQWLIHWENSPPSEATWESTEDLQLRFPNFP